MARKSRRNTENIAVKTAKNTTVGKVYHAALYARISSEDERKRECESMENQVKMLRDYVSSCDDISEYEMYMDRAVTGTKFDRPEFNRMMADMRTGKFDCVIVKDLSRLGRNYLETGDYLESIFPIFGIRFIRFFAEGLHVPAIGIKLAPCNLSEPVIVACQRQPCTHVVLLNCRCRLHMGKQSKKQKAHNRKRSY